MTSKIDLHLKIYSLDKSHTEKMKTRHICPGADNELMQEEGRTVEGFLFTLQKKPYCIMHVHIHTDAVVLNHLLADAVRTITAMQQ